MLGLPVCAGIPVLENEEEEEERGSNAMPYPTLRLPAAGHILYFELLLDDSWNGSDIHVHDVVFSIDVDEYPCVNGAPPDATAPRLTP